MKTVGELINRKVLTDKEKYNKWLFIMSDRIKFFENEYKRIDKAIFKTDGKEIIKQEVLEVSALEAQGGKCFKCGRSWKEITFNNRFAKGKYYQPACQCLFKCPRCKTQLYDYYVTTKLKLYEYACPVCGWYLMDGSKERYGEQYEMWYNNQYHKPENVRESK